MAVTIRLLGPPAIERDGEPAPGPRGHKAWGLLAYLALVDAPPSRHRLATLLFDEADDPRRALRWNLTELRRTLAGVLTVTGDPVVLHLGDKCRLDMHLLSGRRAMAGGATDVVALGGELLEGMSFDDSPGFDTWLAVERHHAAAGSRALLSQAARRALTGSEPATAARAAARAIALDPLDAANHTVLITSFARAGETDRARAHVARCTHLFRRELGIAPPAEVAHAALATPPT